MRSALMNSSHSAYVGRNSWAKVVLPAPFGPAIMWACNLLPRSRWCSSFRWYNSYAGNSRENRSFQPLTETAMLLFPVAGASLNRLSGVEALQRQRLQFLLGGSVGFDKTFD